MGIEEKVVKSITGLNEKAYGFGMKINKRYQTGEKIYTFRMSLVRSLNLALDLSVVLLSWSLFGYGLVQNKVLVMLIGMWPGIHGTACMFQFMRER